MNKTENRIWKRIVRRVKASRGSAYFEFCVFVPILLWGFLFAADFTRILYAEQQVEIATRVLTDIECHLKPGARDPSGSRADHGCPGIPGKRVVRKYLAEALEKEGLYSYNGDPQNSVFCKGSYYTQQGVLHSIVNEILQKILGNQPTGNKFLDILAKIFGTIVDVLTLKTDRYLTEVFPTDKVVKTSVSVLITPFSPGSAYTLFGKHDTSGIMLIPAVAPRLGGGTAAYNRPLLTDQRVRYYCHMPSMDTMALAPYTFIRQLSKIFGKWIGD